MRKTFCTIITWDYLGFAYALYQSLSRFDSNVVLYVLVVDMDGIPQLDDDHPVNVKFLKLKDVSNYSLAKEIIKKYKDNKANALRWTMKPVLLGYLLDHFEDKVIFVDPDIYFFNDYSFLFESLAESNVLLTPHWRSIDPMKKESQLTLVFKEGIFNAGFIGVNKGAKEALLWWSKACLFNCSKEDHPGIYDDQAYLNILPVYFPKVKVLDHLGCNVADWNRHLLKRIKVGNTTLINGEYPVIFVHFTKSILRRIHSGNDPNLKSYMEEYLLLLQKYEVIPPYTPKPGFFEKLFKKIK